MALYDWPQAARFGRVIPKNKIYEYSTANAALKELFVREVEQIVWSYKLAPETINLTATKKVAEIQVIRITVRTDILSHEVLRSIDKAIPFPLIFEIVHEGRIKLAAAYKRPSELNSTRWMVSDYFEGNWLPEDASRVSLPVALDMGALYERLLEPLVASQTDQLTGEIKDVTPEPFSGGGEREPVSLERRIKQVEEIEAQTREVTRLKSRLAREKQFNKRVALNAELRAAKQKLEQMTAGSHDNSP